MSFSENLPLIIHLKSKAHKWKNIALLFALLSLLLLLKITFGFNFSSNVIEGDYIANIKINGVIIEDEFRSEILKQVAEEDSIKAAIINIDSPGGGIVGSEILFNDLRKIANKKPIVVLMGSVAASGGYMAALASDYIIAHNGTLTGSIGVLMESTEFTELAQKIGVKFNNYKSSPLKGSPSPFEKSNPMVDKAIKESIDDSFKFFSEMVIKRRGLKLNQNFFNIIFDGRVFTGRQALKVGLIDKVGDKEDALLFLQEKKIDTKKLPLRDLDIAKKEINFLDNLVGLLPFLNQTKGHTNNNLIMAIMR